MSTRTAHANGVNPLVGKFFHSYKGDAFEWQGRVVAEISNGHFLLQLYEWTGGEPSTQHVVHVAKMADWKFYNSREDWMAARRERTGGAA